MTLDDARAVYPHLGLALYALDPGGPVTLEVLSPEGDLFTFRGRTESEALGRAFPDPAPAESIFD